MMNMASGNLSDSRVILPSGGMGLMKGVTLYYNSLSTRPEKWSHTYDMRIENLNGTQLLSDGTGKRRSYANNNGVYSTQSGDYSTLVESGGQFQLTEKEGTVYLFDMTSGKLLSIADRNGNFVTLTYSGGNLTSIADRFERTVIMTYDAGGRLASVTDPASNVSSMTYDANGYLSTITDPAGNSWTYTYDSDGKMLTKTDQNGNVTSYTYDNKGRLSRATSPSGTKTYDYGDRPMVRTVQGSKFGKKESAPVTLMALNHGGGGQLTITEADGGIWTYLYDKDLSAPTQVTSPNQASTSYLYDGNKNLISKTDFGGNSTTYTYDGNGNMLTMTDALNNTTTYTYNQFGQSTSVMDPQGNLTVYSYDSRGNLLSLTDPSGASTNYQYDADGNVVSVTDAMGRTTTTTYDAYGNPSAITDPAGATTRFTYDISRNMLSQTDASGNTTTFEYNALKQLVKVTDPLNNITTYTYDAKGNKASATDPKGSVTRYEYSYNNQPTSVIDALGSVTTYMYTSTAGGAGCSSCGGGGDKLASVKDANNHTIRYQYDLMGKLAQMTDQLGNVETYTYDANGNLQTVTDRKGQTTTYTYDSLNRVTRVDYADGSFTTYAYDTTGKVTTITDSVSGTIDYTYSTSASGGPVGRVINETTPQGSVSYAYDAIGRRTGMTVMGQPTVNYSYDAGGRLSGIDTLINGGAAYFGISYDLSGRAASVSLPNGVTTNYTYDNASRLLSLQHRDPINAVLESLGYTYDANGNRTSMDRRSANIPAPFPASNILFNEANQMLTFNTRNITYDANGNMTTMTNSCGTTTYTWDARNRLVGIDGFKPDCSSLTASFIYDAMGRRVQKTIDGRTIQYVYDGQDILQEIENGLPSVNYIRTLNIDEPLARIDAATNTVRYYHADALGSIIGLTDENGQEVTKYDYDSFGTVAISGEISDNPFQYTGRESDGTGLYYYRARYYSPELQRFISEDPIRFDSGDVNFYVYVGNNPVKFTDPFGLLPRNRSDCTRYLSCCKKNGDYCCLAYDACRLFKDDKCSKCMRGCLLDEKKCGTWKKLVPDHSYCAGFCFSECLDQLLK